MRERRGGAGIVHGRVSGVRGGRVNLRAVTRQGSRPQNGLVWFPQGRR